MGDKDVKEVPGIKPETTNKQSPVRICTIFAQNFLAAHAWDHLTVMCPAKKG